MAKTPWHTEEWSKGLLLGLTPDPNTGYRAEVWFEYSRMLFNEIREGSLIAVRNFADRGGGAQRDQNYTEYSIMQLDTVHPWHYAIQGPGDRGYPAFTTAAAESARQDWIDHDDRNRDDVTRIRCTAIPLQLAFAFPYEGNELPTVLADRSKPMPGFEAQLLTSEMTDRIVNRGIEESDSVVIGKHLVEQDVDVRVRLSDLFALHFGVFGFTGSGKSNLLSTLARSAVRSNEEQHLSNSFRLVVVDLMDEYTGLLIDQLCTHESSRLIIVGREAADRLLMDAAIATNSEEPPEDVESLAGSAAKTWAERVVLPKGLQDYRYHYVRPLQYLLLQSRVFFYETDAQQGTHFRLSLSSFVQSLGPQAINNSKDQTRSAVDELKKKLREPIQGARESQGRNRDKHLQKIWSIVNAWGQDREGELSKTGNTAIQKFLKDINAAQGSRGILPSHVQISSNEVADLLNLQTASPTLVVIIGENEDCIADFTREVVEETFAQRRNQSLLYPHISFVVDEADVFIGSDTSSNANLKPQATLLARRGRKFGLGLGIATQRIRYLDTSIMAQPHTYFISKLPRKTDREGVADAFAISDESLEQSFAFTPGQWLIASHDATGLKGRPFPVQLPNANDAVKEWLDRFDENQGAS